jgi:hypothetical protein
MAASPDNQSAVVETFTELIMAPPSLEAGTMG